MDYKRLALKLKRKIEKLDIQLKNTRLSQYDRNALIVKYEDLEEEVYNIEGIIAYRAINIRSFLEQK
jgi:hypothetical protein